VQANGGPSFVSSGGKARLLRSGHHWRLLVDISLGACFNLLAHTGAASRSPLSARRSTRNE